MAEQKIVDFLECLSSKEPVPGGGGASALAAAVGMSLGSMVANLTTGKKTYAQYQEEIDEILIQAAEVTKELYSFMDKDAEAFEPLAKAYGLKKDTPEEIAYRDEVMAAALLTASLAPLSLMEKIVDAMKILNRLSVIGSKLAISDVGVGIQMMQAALNGASLNVFINTDLMKDKDTAVALNQKADDFLAQGKQITEETYATVLGKIRK